MNVKQTTHWWPLYQGTYFTCGSKLNLWVKFSIITGCNPGGQHFSSSENHDLNKMLTVRLRQLGLRYQPLLAGNRDFSHSEASFMVECSLPEALEVAAEFEQNAIFWVEQDSLSIVPCLLDNVGLLGDVEQTDMGSFRARLI